MDDPSLLPFLNSNGNGHHYSIDMNQDIEHEEDDLGDDDDDQQQQQIDEENDFEEQEYPEDDIDDDEHETFFLQPPPPQPQLPTSDDQQQLIQSERGGRRKGVPRRLQLSPQIPKVSSTQQRLLPISTSVSKSSSTRVNQHNGHQLLTSDQEDDENHLNDYYHPLPVDLHKQQNYLDYESISDNFYAHDEYDENNNTNYNDEDNVYEIVDDILADIVTIIVRDIRQQRRQRYSKQRFIHNNQTNDINKFSKDKISNGKDHSIKSSKSQSKFSDPSLLFNEFTKMMHLNSQQQLVKNKQPSAISTSPPLTKKQKTSDQSLSLQQQQQQQLLWQMTQQLMMSTQANDTDNASLLKQQLLGLTPPGIPKRVGRPPKQPQSQIQPPQVMRSSTNMIPSTSHSTTNTSPYERGSFAPRRRGRPPKYVTERGLMPGLSTHDLDPTSYDQLFAAIENNVTGKPPSAAFQSALASMLGHQPGLSLPPPPASLVPPPPIVRNGAPASVVKQSAGQTRHSLPSSSNPSKLSSHGLDIPLLAAKKRGPGRPPKSQLLADSHQILQATKRINSSASHNSSTNNFPPTMVPSSSSPTSFNLNAAFVEMLQQQHQHQR